MALLRSAKCIVGGDTGPLHLAIAMGTPAVAIFGPTDPARNGPYPNSPRNPPRLQSDAPAGPAGHTGQDTDPGDADIVLRAPNSVTSHVRNNQTDPSMLAITVESVFNAVRRRIGAIT
jgi:heptosyltransferase-1